VEKSPQASAACLKLRNDGINLHGCPSFAFAGQSLLTSGLAARQTMENTVAFPNEALE
jgi:hypothetical protein